MEKVATSGREAGKAESEITATIECLDASFQRGRFHSRINPIAYSYPATSARDALVRHDAWQLWIRGLAEDQDERAWEWLQFRLKSDWGNANPEPYMYAEFLNQEWVKVWNGGKDPETTQALPFPSVFSATKPELIRAVVGYFWLNVELAETFHLIKS
jgi:hypothetical protein